MTGSRKIRHRAPDPARRPQRLLPLLLATALLAGSGCAAAPRLLAPPAVPLPDKGVHLIAVGDIMMGTNFPSDDFLNPDLPEDADLAKVIGKDLLRLLGSADITFGNMEGTLYDGDGPSKYCSNPSRCYAFRSPEYHAGFLKAMGFDLMSIANNHNGDFLDAGRNATMGALSAHGIGYAGLDRDGARTATRILKNGLRVGLAAFAPNIGTLSINDPERAEAIVQGLAASHDIVIVSFHGGAEGAQYTRVPKQMERFVGEDRGDVYAFAHRVIDAGADVVLGHGPHVPRAVEIYRGRLIAYSLGNFWTYGRFNLKGLNGVAPVVELVTGPDGTLRAAKIHSVRQAGWGVPRLDRWRRALKAVKKLTKKDFPEGGLVFTRDGTLIPPRPLTDDAATAKPTAAEKKATRKPR